jgi:hypothetical protein
MAPAATTTRAPRGTKVLTKAFFMAADNLPAAQRAVVIKAALVAIRDDMRASRGKATVKKMVKLQKKPMDFVRAGVAKKKMGRPIGSKNKPKVVEAPVVSEEVVVEAAKKTARRAKQAPVEMMATE